MNIQRAAEQVITDLEEVIEGCSTPAQFVEEAVECLFLQGNAQQQADTLDAVLASPRWASLIHLVIQKFNLETHGWLYRQVHTQLEAAKADAVVFRRIAMVEGTHLK